MARWFITRRALLLATFFSFFGYRSQAATAPTVKLASTPTSTTAIFNVLSPSNGTGYIEYGTKVGVYSNKSAPITFTKGVQKSITISGLKPATKFYFRLRNSYGSKSFSTAGVLIATTAVASKEYVFTIQADPHMDENSSEEVYIKTLDQVAALKPSFLMDLGDIFMVDKLSNKSEANIRARYELMKKYYARLQGVPLKITLGNHDGELGYSTFNTKKYRAEYFPEQTASVSYFAFTEENSLHISLDPFTYTTENPKADGWQWTLGKVQYDWFKQVLETSQAPFKFIYIHHLLVGDPQSRGGVEIAQFNEWGGKNKDGSYGFDQMRPGWGKPIHQLLKENKVSAVFKGHDHLYVKQDLDGIVYQTLPQPSHPGDKINSGIEYGYLSGKTIGGSGFIKVTTSEKSARVDFILYDGKLGDSYNISLI
jgi:hypothetical protein